MFGIAVVTTYNQVLTVGEVKYSFSIQSISKVFSLALATDEQGAQKVLEKWNKILDFYSKAAGEKLVLIDEVYKSEAAWR
jgi:glutaminase